MGERDTSQFWLRSRGQRKRQKGVVMADQRARDSIVLWPLVGLGLVIILYAYLFRDEAMKNEFRQLFVRKAQIAKTINKR